MSLADFVSHVYMPFIEAEKRPSTVRGYRDMWDDHIAKREQFCKMLMRELRTCHVQQLLDAIAREDKTKNGTPLAVHRCTDNSR